MIPYILYAALILTACLIFYKLLLQKETFFHLNRMVLITCMLLAFILPLVHIPAELSFRNVASGSNTILPDVTTFQNITVQPVKEYLGTAKADAIQQPTHSINYTLIMQWLVWLYWFGVILFAGNFLMQAFLLLYKAYSREAILDGKFRIVEVSGDKAPCSFGNTIFINPEKYDWETYNQVLLHEKIHIGQRHTFDLLLAEIVLIFQWFNPFAWQWRKELENNLEFYTDHKLLQQPEVEKETYQLSLLKVAAPHFPLSLTTNYNQSLLKKRIVMMNAKRSNLHTTWKYFFLLPLMIAFVCFFNETVATAQSTTKKEKQQHNDNNGVLRTSGNWFATIKDNQVNIQFTGDDSEKASNNSSFPISDFKDLPRDKQGAFTLTRDAGTMNFTGKFEGNKGMGEYQFAPDKNYTADMGKEGVDISKEGDAMVFFFVNIKKDYAQMLKKQGYTDLDKDKLIPLAALGVDEAYIRSIKQAGFTDVGLDNLVPLKALGVDKAYIDEIRKAGYKEITPDKMITLKAQGIDGKYITDYRNSAGISKKDLDDNDLEINGQGNKNNNNNNNNNNNKHKDKDDDGMDDLIAFKAMNIDQAFINSFREVGYDNLANEDLISMKALNITPAYVKGFKDAGYAHVKPEELVGLKSQNVTPELIKQYKDLGFNDLSLDDVIGAKATGTTPAFIKSMRDKGHKQKSLDKYIAMKTILGE